MAKWIYLLLCLGFLFLGTPLGQEQSMTGSRAAPVAIPASAPASVPRPEPVHVTIAAVGDIMMHTPQITAAHDTTSDTYNFLPAFHYVRPYLATADLTLGNLETPLAGRSKGYPGYPRFNAPDELAQDLRQIGFDVIITANNHALDQGPDGVARTIEILETAGLQPVGTARNATEGERVTIKEVKGIKIAVLAYTYGTNGLPVPANQPYLVNLLDKGRIKQDITRAREARAEIVLVYLHFGQEYVREPSPAERQLATELAVAGADIILGSHPHVLQGGERLGEAGEKLVLYSLGNFISAQKGDYRQIGAIWKIHLEKDPVPAAIRIEQVTYLPTYTCRYREEGRLQFTLIPLANVSKVASWPAGLLPDPDRVAQVWDEMNATLGEVGTLERAAQTGP